MYTYICIYIYSKTIRHKAGRNLLNSTMHFGSHLVLALVFEALWRAYRESVIFLCSFTTLFWHASSFISSCQEDSLLCVATVALCCASKFVWKRLFEMVSRMWHFCLLLKMYVDKKFMECNSEIDKDTCMHIYTLLHNTMSRHRRWNSCTIKHPGPRGGGLLSKRIIIQYADPQQY